ncbi:MAG: C4-dicarboxylate TRAP transporter substrate-binding protein [Rhodovibrionaceae bacterium]
MKYRKYASIAITSGMAIACFALTAAESAAETKSIQYSSYAPESHLINTGGIVPFIELVERDTGGSLDIEFRPGGVLSNARTTLSAVSSGAVDGGFIVGVYTPQELPMNNTLSDLGLSSFDPRVLTGAINEMALLDCETCLEEWEQHNVVPFGAISTTPYLLLCNGEYNTLADLRGKKVRAPSTSVPLAQALSMTPVNIASTEIYEALQRNQVDCSFGSLSHIKNYSLWDVLESVVALPVGSTFGHQMLTFNADVWEGLTPEQKAAMRKHAPHALRGVLEAYTKGDETSKQEVIEKGIAWIEPTQEMLDVVAAQQAEEASRMVEMAESRGIPGAQKEIAVFMQKIDKWTNLVSEEGYSWEDYEDDLAAEIYSRLPQ